MANYDVIVIGGGHNGLTTAALLAQAGRRVLVLEKNDTVGGLARQEEFHPGYKTAGLLHDTGGVRMDLIKKLNLQAHGLRTTGKRAPVSLLSNNGKAITLHADVDASVRSIERVSEKDARAYRQYRGLIDKIGPWIGKLLNEPQPDLMAPSPGEMMRLLGSGLGLRRLGKKTMRELLKIIPMCVADFLNEHFETDFLIAGMAVPAIQGSFNGPWSSFTTMNLLLWESTSKEQVLGGPAALAFALEKAAVHNGVEIRTGAEVARLVLADSGTVEGVRLDSGEQIDAPLVAASCTPKEVFLHLLTSREVGPKLEADISHLRCRGTTAKVNLALDKKIQWKAETERPIAFARTGNHVDEMERAFDAVKYRRCSETPVLDIFVPTVSNSDLAPEGHEVVSILAQFAPYERDGGWTEAAKEEFADRVVARLAQHTSGLEASIVARHISTPSDMEAQYNLTGGNLFHAEHAIDQLLGRPVPSCAGYRTPIPGLFLCGSGSHPGGGITCAPGALASRAILADA